MANESLCRDCKNPLNPGSGIITTLYARYDQRCNLCHVDRLYNIGLRACGTCGIPLQPDDYYWMNFKMCGQCYSQN